jgi:16S rRNA (cytosine967-C5)-methyltransferase
MTQNNNDTDSQTNKKQDRTGIKESPLFHGARGVAVRILNRVERTDAYLDKLINNELRSTDLSDQDKGLLNEIVTGVIRWQMKLDWVLNGFYRGNFPKADINVKNAMRVALYQMMFLERIPHHAAVNEAVEFVKRLRSERYAGVVNGVLRNIQRHLHEIRYPDRSENLIHHLSVFYSHPIWIVRRWLERYGEEETEKLLAANNEKPPLTIRINKIKIQPAEFVSLLEKEGLAYTPSKFLDYYVQLHGAGGMTQLGLFRNGYFSIQDESAGIVGKLLDPQRHERVIDLCSAPGGKTTHIAELMNNTGEVLSVEKYQSRADLVRSAADRLGLTNIRIVTEDAEEFNTPIADRVLVDVPCTGLGVLRKKPDIKLKRDVSDIQKLTEVQYRLLEKAASLTKPGGILVYSTCTIEPDENEAIVQRFLENNKHFTIDDPTSFVSKAFITPRKTVETFPHKHTMDGSFAARLRRLL